MYLNTLKICNFRKFSNCNNVIGFVKSSNSLTVENLVASSTTLVIGKNNSGKTTVTKALEILVSDTEKITGHDFNYNYLKSILEEYTHGKFDNLPTISFELDIIADDDENDNAGLLGPFIDIRSALLENYSRAFVDINYELKDKSAYKFRLEQLIEEAKNKGVNVTGNDFFRKFIDLLTETQFQRKIKNSSGVVIEKTSIKELIDLKIISSAKNIHDKRLLTKSFNKIIKFMYECDILEHTKILDIVESNNDRLTTNIKSKHQLGVESILKNIISDKAIGIELRSDLTFDKLMADLITYEHRDGDFLVPESQFGLGYASLVSIIGEIIDYSNQGYYTEKQSRIKLLCIEEPEVFMHPQMQINFVRHIQEALTAILGSTGKDIKIIKSQIVITTHSSHILNSVIQSSSSLDDINFIYTEKGSSSNIVLKDELISGNTIELDQFKFLKKHIKHQVPELFFSDAIILVEGITEERVLNYYIEKDPKLSRMHISIFRIDGAHGKVYSDLIKTIKIPTLIITDIDFSRPTDKNIGADDQSNSFEQVTRITEHTKTTNATLTHFYQSEKISDYIDYYVEDYLMVTFQKNGIHIGSNKDTSSVFYATSFEEAFILENYNNNILHAVLHTVLGKTIEEIIGNEKCYEHIALRSYLIQRKLAEKKSNFSNSLIFSLVTGKSDIPILPQYIKDGLDWISIKITGSDAYYGF